MLSPARVRVSGVRPSSAQARLPAIHSGLGDPSEEDDPYERVLLIPVSTASCTWPSPLGISATTHQTMLSVDFLPDAFHSRDYATQIPSKTLYQGFLNPERVPDDVTNKLSTLEKEMMDRFHDLDVLKQEVQHLQGSKSGRRQSSKSPESLDPGGCSSTQQVGQAPPLRRGKSASPTLQREEGETKTEVIRLRKDRRVMAELLKQSQRDLTKRDLVIGQLQRANSKLQKDLERLLESLTSDSPVEKAQDISDLQPMRDEAEEDTLNETRVEEDASNKADLIQLQKAQPHQPTELKSPEISRSPNYKRCLLEVVEAVAESPLTSHCEIEGGIEVMRCRTCLAENGHCFDVDRFREVFKVFWRNVSDKVEALERKTVTLETTSHDKEASYSQLLKTKEQHLSDLMSEMRKVSVQLERQMETVMELHDESAALRRENERLGHQLEDAHIRKGLVQAKCRDIQAKYSQLEKEQEISQEVLSSQFRSHWQEQLDKVLDFLSHAEGKLSSKGRTATSIEEILRMRPSLSNREVKKLEGAVLKVYENELQWIRTSLMDRENNNNEKYRNAITSPFKLEKTYETCDLGGSNQNYEQILYENVGPDEDWKKLSVAAISEANPSQRFHELEHLEPPIEKGTVESDCVDWDDLFGRFYYDDDDLPESDNDSSDAGGNQEDEENPCSTFTINEERDALETIPEAEETSMSEASVDNSKPEPVQSEPNTPTVATSTTVMHNPVFQDLPSGPPSSLCSSCNMIDPEDGTELIPPESWDLTETLPIDLLKSSCKRDINYSPSRNTFLYPMIEEEEEEAGSSSKVEHPKKPSMVSDMEAEVCQYYADQCALEEDDALSVILETDSENDEESELRLVLSVANELSAESGDEVVPCEELDDVFYSDAPAFELDLVGHEGGEGMADDISRSSCVLVQVQSAPVIMNVTPAEVIQGEASPENGERLSIVCTNCGEPQRLSERPELQVPVENGHDECHEENRTEDDISTTFEDIIEEILHESDSRNRKSSDTKLIKDNPQTEIQCPDVVEDAGKTVKFSEDVLPDVTQNDVSVEERISVEVALEVEREVNKSERSAEDLSNAIERRETWSQTESAVESVLREPPPQSEASEAQTDIVGNQLDERLVELETAICEMKEVKEQHMKVACGVAEQLETLRSQESQWLNKESHYKDEVRAWRDNVQLQNGVLQQLREDLEATQDRLKTTETGAHQLRERVAELQSRLVDRSRLTHTQTQTNEDYNQELLLYIDKLRAEADCFREEMRRQEAVIQDVRLETEKTISHFLNLKTEAAEKIQRETAEWQRIVKDKDSEINILRGELLQLSDLVEKKGVIISQQIQNIKDLLSELNRCETELHAKGRLVQEIQEQREQEQQDKDNRTHAQGDGQTEEEKLLSIGELCMREQHPQTLAQQSQLLDRLHRRLRALEEQLETYTIGSASVGGTSSLGRRQPHSLHDLEERFHQHQEGLGGGGARQKASTSSSSFTKLRQQEESEGVPEEEDDEEDAEVRSAWSGRDPGSEPVNLLHDDYFASILEKAHRMADQDGIAVPLKKVTNVRTLKDRPVPLPFKTGKILFLQQDLENRRKEILKTEIKLRRIQAKMAEEVKKGRQPLKAT